MTELTYEQDDFINNPHKDRFCGCGAQLLSDEEIRLGVCRKCK
jgi:hypothetical protein